MAQEIWHGNVPIDMFPNPFRDKNKKKKTYEEVLADWGIPGISPTGQSILDSLHKTAAEGYGSDYVYDQTVAKTRGITLSAGDQLRTVTGRLSGRSGSLSMGAHANIEGLIRAQTAGKVSGAVMGVESANEEAKTKARTAIFNYLTAQQGMAADIMTANRGYELQKDLSSKQLRAQEGDGCALAAALYGPDSIDEYMLKIWEKMHIRMNRGKNVRRRVYWNWFRGYHWIAPKVVSCTKYGALRAIRESITKRFVRYCARDVFNQRQNPIDVASALLVGVMSTIGWGLKKWHRRSA